MLTKMLLYNVNDKDCDVYCRVRLLSLEDINNAKVLGSIERRRTAGLKFSPKNTFLATWEPLSGLLFILSSFLI